MDAKQVEKEGSAEEFVVLKDPSLADGYRPIFEREVLSATGVRSAR